MKAFKVSRPEVCRYLERGLVISNILKNVLAVSAVVYLQNDSKYTFAFAQTTGLKFKFCCIVSKVIINVTYKGFIVESEFENEPKFIFNAIS